jgi:hypothetical protein
MWNGSRRNCYQQGVTHSLTTEVYVDGWVESDRILCCESPSEGAQIQYIILYYFTNDSLVVILDWMRQTVGTRPNKL